MKIQKMLDFQLDKNKLLMQHSLWMLNNKFKIEFINQKCAKQLKNLI